MNVLVGCEQFGRVRDAFRALGHDAWSCDIEPAEPFSSYHLRGDVLSSSVLNFRKWDLAIFFPPCTYLCSSGLHWNKRVPERQAKTEKALKFVNALLSLPIEKIALENPVGCISTKIRKYDQKIQPWMFGEDASKGTCLWLKGLPKLVPTKIVPPGYWREVKYAADLPLCPDCNEEVWCEEHEKHFADCCCIGPTQDGATYKTIEGFQFATLTGPPVKPVWANQTPSGQNKLGPSKNRGKIRGITYQGIADAMATQWRTVESEPK
jgi:hypothetical protein